MIQPERCPHAAHPQVPPPKKNPTMLTNSLPVAALRIMHSTITNT